MPASIGSNQASPANKDAACAACVVVLSSPMAWSPPARQRRSWLVEKAGDSATFQFHHFRDGTAPLRLAVCVEHTEQWPARADRTRFAAVGAGRFRPAIGPLQSATAQTAVPRC